MRNFKKARHQPNRRGLALSVAMGGTLQALHRLPGREREFEPKPELKPTHKAKCLTCALRPRTSRSLGPPSLGPSLKLKLCSPSHLCFESEDEPKPRASKPRAKSQATTMFTLAPVL
jgi:hypothetical protein